MTPDPERRMQATPIPIPDPPRAQRRALMSVMDERPHGSMQTRAWRIVRNRDKPCRYTATRRSRRHHN
jgi:hypothetical protein